MLLSLLSFGTSPLGRAVIGGLAVVAFVAYMRFDAAQEARAEAAKECLQANQSAIELALRHQLAASQAALNKAQSEAVALRKQAAKIEEETDALLTILRENKSDSCRIPDAVRDRLRTIR